MPKRLLVIDPIPTHRIRLKAALRAAQYEIVTVDRIACAVGAIIAAPVDMILLNTSGVQPAQILARLRRAIDPLEVPILCRDDEAGPIRRTEALATGARDMVSTRIPETLLLARLRALLREGDAATELEHRRVAAASFGFGETAAAFQAYSRIVCITLSGDSSGFIGLPSTSSRVVHLTSKELLGDDTQTPDAIMLRTGGASPSLLDCILPEIRSRAHLRDAAVLVLHPSDAHEVAVQALNLGAAEVAEEESTPVKLAMRIDAMLSRKKVRDTLRQTTEESLRLATTDPLTGLYNRRYADVYLADVVLRSRESGRGFTVMMIDVDHFKAVNDTYGHAVGDRVLTEIAARMRDNVRAVDLVSRHGGEEFLVILPDIDGAEAEPAADRIRSIMAEKPFILEDSASLRITVSVGVAVATAAGLSVAKGVSFAAEELISRRMTKDLLDAADHALYSAKNAGRNRVSVSPPAASAA